MISTTASRRVSKILNTPKLKLTTTIDIANFDINDGTRDLYDMFDLAPPPAPKLKTPGVIAMDITSKFAQAAQGMCCVVPVC